MIPQFMLFMLVGSRNLFWVGSVSSFCRGSGRNRAHRLNFLVLCTRDNPPRQALPEAKTTFLVNFWFVTPAAYYISAKS